MGFWISPDSSQWGLGWGGDKIINGIFVLSNWEDRAAIQGDEQSLNRLRILNTLGLKLSEIQAEMQNRQLGVEVWAGVLCL